MDSTRVLLILQKVLRDLPDEVLFMITEIYIPNNTHLCPICGYNKTWLSKSNTYPDSFHTYLQNSKERFGEKSWELCHSCWRDGDVCSKCYLPHVKYFALTETTGVRVSLNVCRHCREIDLTSKN